ncbi:MAG: preprotein translocase subunit SecE [Alphaproteobacteria bacterium]
MKTEDKKGTLGRAAQFVGEVRTETRKVTWPSRRETLMTTLFVFVFALIAAIYFMLVDNVIYRLIQFVIHLGQ